MARKVLVTEELDPAGISVLKNRGFNVDVTPRNCSISISQYEFSSM